MRAKVLIALVAALALAYPALAKGPPDRVTISGGTLAGEITVTGDQAILDALQMMSLEDYDTLTPDAPEGISGDGYLITRYLENSLTGGDLAFDQLRYYSDPAGGRGYIHYIGIINGASEYDGKWFRATASGEAALTSVIAGAERASSAARQTVGRVFFGAIAALIRVQ